jgi:hypothetical protein
MGCAADKYGAYKINDVEFPVPTTRWEEQPVAAGLNGISILSSYRTHVWSWPFLDGAVAEQLFALYDQQQSTNTPLTSIETDPYDASGSSEIYGTVSYTNFTILSVGTRTRGLPFYDDVSLTAEIYVA